MRYIDLQIMNFDQLHSYITSVACTDPQRGTIMDGGGGGIGVYWVWSPSARGGRYGKNITFFFFFEISCFTILSILCHVGFSILQVV